MGNIGDRLALAVGGGRVHVAWTDGRTPGDDYDVYTHSFDALAVAIAVPRFAAEGGADGVRVRWTLADDRGVTGFRVHREGAGVVAMREAVGEGEYEVLDAGVTEGASAEYRLEIVRGTASEWLGPVPATRPLATHRLAFRRTGPNPFAREVGMDLALPRSASVSVRVHDVTGQEVARLHEGELAAGVHALRWDGRTARGTQAAPGVYLVRAQAGSEETVQRVVRVE
jgi:hypothetical protein